MLQRRASSTSRVYRDRRRRTHDTPGVGQVGFAGIGGLMTFLATRETGSTQFRFWVQVLGLRRTHDTPGYTGNR
jgi:hypothetical protein